jgi:MFS transporter, PAT family, beta-lactamase induction signal transducer AmpG
MSERLGTWDSLTKAFSAKRFAVVTLFSFASGLPLGLVWIAIPVWLKDIGVDIRVVGLLTLFQAPWSFKFLWSPFVDRYRLPFLGRRRGYVAASQVGLLLTGLALTAVSGHPERFGVIAAICLAIALISATQDIAIDAYVVEVLKEGEQGLAVGARTAMYRIAMNLSGGLAISLAGEFGWAAVNLMLALFYVPCLLLTLWADEPEVEQKPPATLRQAVWEPFLGLLARPRAVEILLFVVLFKFGDAFTQSLQRPFFREVGFNLWDVGIVSSTIGTIGIWVGVFVGALLTNAVGLGRALWITGFLQAFSNAGYAWVAEAGPVPHVLYAATAFEYIASGLGTGAFGVLLLRLTEKRFSATQYALLSSLFSIPRIIAGPPSGLLADTLGWTNFFLFTVVLAIPGMVMLSRFVPWNQRELTFAPVEDERAPALDGRALLRFGGLFGFLCAAACVAVLSALEATKAYRKDHTFPWAAETLKLVAPETLGAWLSLLSALAAGLVLGLALAALWLTREVKTARS